MTGSILVFGGTRGTGHEVVLRLRGRGDAVTALVREGSDAGELEALGATVVRGDALDPAAVDRAFGAAVHAAVVCTLGGGRAGAPRADHDGVREVVAGARRAGVRRLVLVTAIGAGDSRAAVAPKVIEVLGPVLELKTRAEACVTASGLDYTILRPGGMTSDPATGTAIRTGDHATMGVITRADLARLIVDCLDDAATIGHVYHTVDPEIRWQAPLQRGEDPADGPRRR